MVRLAAGPSSESLQGTNPRVMLCSGFRMTAHRDGAACSGAVVRKPARNEPAGDTRGQTAKAMSASKFWNILMLDSPGSGRTVFQEGMCSESSEPLAGRLGAPAQRRDRV